MRDLIFNLGMACAVCGLVLAIYNYWRGRK